MADESDRPRLSTDAEHQDSFGEIISLLRSCYRRVRAWVMTALPVSVPEVHGQAEIGLPFRGDAADAVIETHIKLHPTPEQPGESGT